MNHDLRIVLADDHQVVLDGLRPAIEREPRWRIIGEARTGAAAWQLIEEQRPDVAILDIYMRESEDGEPGRVGFDLARRIRRHGLPVRVVFLTVEESAAALHFALRELGACGYVLKESATEEIADCLRAVAADRPFVSQRLTGALLRLDAPHAPRAASFPGWSRLTPREREVLRLISEGKSGKEIVSELRIGEGTERGHRNRVSRKLGLYFSHSLLKFAIAHREEIAELCRDAAGQKEVQ